MYKQHIENFINNKRSDIVECTKRIVKIPSVAGEAKEGMPFGEGPDAALKETLKLAQELGFITTNYDGYVGAIDCSNSETGLDILAHLDVVPANPEEWTVCNPYKPIELDGKIYGRGTSDDKGPVISALYAMLAVKELNIPLKKNVRLIVGTNEESGSKDIEYYYKTHNPAPATFSPDSSFPVINVEKGRLNSQIVAKYKADSKLPKIISATAGHTGNVIPDSMTIVTEGLDESSIKPIINGWSDKTKQTAILEKQENKLIIKTKGVGGHAAMPEHGNNALTAGLELIGLLPFADSESFQKIKALSNILPHNDWAGKAAGVSMADDISGSLTISLNIFEADTEGFTATFDSRTPICATKENTIDVLDSICKENKLEQKVLKVNTFHHVPEESPFIQTLLKAYEDNTGLKGECLAIGGGTYVHDLENAVAFGLSMPGVENNVHGADEFINIDDMILGAKIFAQVIIDLCS